MVFADNIGVVKLVPVPKAVPPVKASYQVIVPEVVVAFNTTVPFPQREAGVTETTGAVLIVARTDVFVAVLKEMLLTKV